MYHSLRFSLLGIIGTTLLLGGCGFSSDTNRLTTEEAQDIFNEAFITSQTGSSDVQEKTFNDQIKLKVNDNKNDVLPHALESLTLDLLGEYDFTDPDKIYIDLTANLFFNQSPTSDLGFSFKLKGKNLDYMLTDLTPRATDLLGVTDTIGGPEGVDLIRAIYLKEKQNLTLSQAEYEELVHNLTNLPAEQKITINNSAEEKAIAESFTENEVFTITEVQTDSSDNYLFRYVMDNQAIIDFLEDVARINGLERNFANLTPELQHIDLSGTVEINPNKKITRLDGEAFVQRELLNTREDKIITFEYLQNPNTLHLELINPISQLPQASLEIPLNIIGIFF